MNYEELLRTGSNPPDAVVSCGSPEELLLENAEYHRHPGVSKSHLDKIARSPLHYWAHYLDPNREEVPPTDAMRFGSALHTLVLEPQSWDDRYIIAPKVDRRTKAGKEAWEAFTMEAGSRELIGAEDRITLSRMAEAVWSHPAASHLLTIEGEAETTHMWVDEETGLTCKCRPDWLTRSGALIVDVKTTEDASPAGFRKSIANYRYHVQAAWYLHGMELATGNAPEQFLFVCVEKKPPYAVAVYAASTEMIIAGWETARRDLDRLAECKAANKWPGYSDAIELIDLPAWMKPRPDGSIPTIPDIETF